MFIHAMRGQFYWRLNGLETELLSQTRVSPCQYLRVFTATGTSHLYIIPIIKSLSKNPKWLNVNF